MTKADEKYWFKPKKYGWGWGMPSNRKGWLAFGTFFAIWLLALTWVVLAQSEGELHSTDVTIFTSIIILDVIGLVFVSFKYGEAPKWLGGKKHDSTKS